MNRQNKASIVVDQKVGTFGLMGRPEDVVSDRQLTTAEKRAVLEGWASKANAVDGLPSLRQLDDGSIVELEEVLSALRSLNDAVGRQGFGFLARRQRMLLSRLLKRRDDDDDDPPPSPASASVPIAIKPIAEAMAA